MAFPRLGGPGIPLNNPLNYPTAPAGQVFTQPIRNNQITLQGGEIFLIPAGTYWIQTGGYSFIQFLDPVTTQWKTYDTAATKGFVIDSDGGNWRIANLTGCPIGAVVTNAGSGYTNGVGATATGLTVTASSGSSTWVPVIGGAINTSLTSSAAGASYAYPPHVVIDAPPAGGIQATATCTISSGGVNAVTVTNQGAGYSSAPGVTFVNDFRDSAGSGAVYTTALTGSGSLTALYPSNNGTAITAVPTFTFAPASTTAATAVMNFSVTGYTVTAAGTTYTAPVMIGSGSNLNTAASILTNPASTRGLTLPRPCRIVAGLSTSTVVTTGLVIEDSGLGIQIIPSATVTTDTYPAAANSATLVLTVGGVVDTVTIQPI